MYRQSFRNTPQIKRKHCALLRDEDIFKQHLTQTVFVYFVIFLWLWFPKETQILTFSMVVKCLSWLSSQVTMKSWNCKFVCLSGEFPVQNVWNRINSFAWSSRCRLFHRDNSWITGKLLTKWKIKDNFPATHGELLRERYRPRLVIETFKAIN